MIQGEGSVVFEQKASRVSQVLVAACYQRRRAEVLSRRTGHPEREYSLRQLIDRVTKTIADEGEKPATSITTALWCLSASWLT